jgi:hypothetical protein
MATLLSSQTQETAGTSVSQFNLQQMTKHYQADQQVKYLHLQAEIEVLLQQLTTLKQQQEILTELPAKSS